MSTVMPGQHLNLSRFVVTIVPIALLLAFASGGVVSAAPPSQPIAPAALVTDSAPVMSIDSDGDNGDASQFSLDVRLFGHDRHGDAVNRSTWQQGIQGLQDASVTKTVTPTTTVEDGGELTYTLVISAAPGVQVSLYDPLTDTIFVRFVERPPIGVITHTGGVITGALTVTPTNQVTVSFAVLVDVSSRAEQTDGVANRACVYPFGGMPDGCVWSNEVINPLGRGIYLPLVLGNYTPVHADFVASPTSGAAPLTVVFTNTSLGGYDASLWDFGDGITNTQTSPTHTYTVAGTYTVTLTVSGLGGTDTLTRANYITVSRPLTCVERVANGGFEYDGDWVIPTTEYPATYTTVVTRSGERSMRVGIVDPDDNRYSFSSAQQTVSIPADAVSVTLRFWLFPLSEEPPVSTTLLARPLANTLREAALSGDRQYVVVYEGDSWINTLIWQRTDDRQWEFHEFDLGVYAGRTIKLWFGAYNDGEDGITAMYVDDVSLEICYPPTASRSDVQRCSDRGAYADYGRRFYRGRCG